MSWKHYSCTRNNCSENFPTNKLTGDVSAHEGEEKNLATGYTENSAPLAAYADTDCAVSENQGNFAGSSKSEKFQLAENTANERAEQNCVPYAEKVKNSTIDNGENFAPVAACADIDCKINGEELSNALSNDCAENSQAATELAGNAYNAHECAEQSPVANNAESDFAANAINSSSQRTKAQKSSNRNTWEKENA